MKINIISKTDVGKEALEKALWVKDHAKEAEAMLTKFKERFAFRQALKQYELKVIEKEPLAVEYEVRHVAQLMAGSDSVKKGITRMMNDYGAEEEDYEVQL